MCERRVKCFETYGAWVLLVQEVGEELFKTCVLLDKFLPHVVNTFVLLLIVEAGIVHIADSN